MNRKAKIIIISVFVAVLILLVYLVWAPGKNPSPGQNKNQSANYSLPGIDPGIKLPETAEEAQKQSNLSALALNFAEKYGSYSSQSGFQNLLDLKYMMTQEMTVKTDSYIMAASKNMDVNRYNGYSTKALSINILSENENQASLKVKTQRSEYQGNLSQPRVFYQDLLINFIKKDGAWKVHNAIWQ
ncbi:hypothetical protein C4569_04105 [Candidatus Parcubacteria bacterium]|nr:MAG: hypothetical protein C4569_04105 [Candidatus Parcubacteria bacterium]